MAVIHVAGRVISYQVNFPAGTRISQAKADILAHEFPSDSSIKWTTSTPGSCYELGVQSPLLTSTARANKIDDASGIVQVDFYTGATGYDPNNVGYAVVNFIDMHSC